MEDVLEVYAMPYNPNISVVCMDEQPYQLLDEKVAPMPMQPGNVLKKDYEYVRKGSCSIFMFTEPLGKWRHIKASERRSKVDWDWALQIKELLDVHYSDAERIRFVMGNLNTHKIFSLYEAF